MTSCVWSGDTGDIAVAAEPGLRPELGHLDSMSGARTPSPPLSPHFSLLIYNLTLGEEPRGHVVIGK